MEGNIMSKHLRGVIVVLVLLASSLVGPSPAQSAPEDFSTACPEMSDSVYRLYTAVFLREPDQTGFETWLDNYAQGGWHLLRIAQFFTDSPEFQERYGALDNGQFVDLIYTNVFGRTPDAGGRAHWVGELDAGMTRGKMLLFFSESEEYVLATDTFAPLAGYLRSYAHTTKFQCGDGNVIITFGGPVRYLDIFMDNLSGSDAEVSAVFLGANGEVVRDSGKRPVIPAGSYLYQWGADVLDYGPEFENAVYGIQVTAPDNVFVIGIGSNQPMPDDRPGWEGTFGARP